MDRRTFLGTLAGGVLMAPLAAVAHRCRRIGVLSPASPGASPLLDAFRNGLGELGGSMGGTFAWSTDSPRPGTNGYPASLPSGRLKVEVIFAINSVAAQAALKATTTIPIVFTWVADPLSLVPNLSRPGGNVTGLATITTELSGKRLQLFKDVLPGITRIAVLWNPAVPAATRVFDEMEGAAAQFGVQLHPDARARSERASTTRSPRRSGPGPARSS